MNIKYLDIIISYSFKGEKMTKTVLGGLLIVITIMLSGCGGTIGTLSPASQSAIDAGTTMYTKVSMWTEKNKVIGTNYAVGMHIPVNSPVTIVDIDAKVVTFNYDGQDIKYEVYTKYTRVNAAQMLERLFSKSKSKLSKHSAKIKESIANGLVITGMSKNEVLLARGFPPFHQTQGIKSDKWKYWRHRFATALVTFKNDKVVGIKGTPSE